MIEYEEQCNRNRNGGFLAMRGKRWIQKITAAALAAAVAVSLSGTGFAKETVVYAAEEAAQAAVPQVLPQPTPEEAYAAAGFVRSVYTNEWIPAEQAGVRPIAVMMPTDRIAQPSYGISNAKILYEIMEEGEISRQMAIIDDWTGLPKIGNVRSCRAYYLPEATEWDPILVHFGGVVYMKDRITAPDINNITGAQQ